MPVGVDLQLEGDLHGDQAISIHISIDWYVQVEGYRECAGDDV